MMTMADTLSVGEYRPLPEYPRAALERVLRAQGRDTGPLDDALQRTRAMPPFPEAAGARSERRLVAVVPDPDVRGDRPEDVARKLVAAGTPVG
jgi:hypothetical protein